MERKLASIQTIDKLEPIDGADRIVRATILGWHIVVGKDEFNVGDKCIFFEIDSMIPKSAFGKLEEGHDDFLVRLKTKKMKGVISQGLALPLRVFNLEDMAVGTDVTDRLGITKYDPPETNRTGGLILGQFPHFIPKTDEMRVQSFPNVISEIMGEEVYITTKMDGTSASYYLEDGELCVCSRNNKLADGDNVYWNIAKKLDMIYRLERAHPYKIAIQGELCGPGIQKNTADLKELALFAFNVWDMNNHAYMNGIDAINLIHDIGLQSVPVQEVCEFNFTLARLLDLAKGKYPNTNRNREGIVIRPIPEKYSPTLQGRLSFKVINNDYLLRE